MEVNSRFGRSSTTGVAHVYSNSEAAENTVPTYVKDRHVRRGAHSEPVEEEPVEEESEDAEADEEGS